MAKHIPFAVIVVVFGLIGLSSIASAEETGTVTGRVRDSQTAEPLIGASVLVEGTTLGAATDIEGRFEIQHVPQGSKMLQVTYISYSHRRIPVEIAAGERTVVDVALDPEVIELQGMTIETKIQTDQDGGQLVKQRQSINVYDGISAAQITRSGDSNAADALKRITGASVVDGKYVAVRGLGGRYANAQVNGGPIPSPEPDRKAIPLTLFPSALLESISILKTFTPDLPGVFGGGAVDIRTKAYPDERVVNFKLAASDRSYYHNGIKFLRADGGKLDFFGYDDGSRAMPKDIPDDRMLSIWSPPAGTDYESWSLKLADYGRQFENSFTLKETSPVTPLSFGFDVGNRFSPHDDLEYGYFGNFTFSNDYVYEDIAVHRYSLAGQSLATTYDFVNKESSYNTNLAAGLSGGIEWRNAHKLKLYQLYTHSSQDEVIFGVGKTPNVERGVFIKEEYTEKTIWNSTLLGEHELANGDKHILEWKLNGGLSLLSQPDMKTHNYDYDQTTGLYNLVTSSTKPGVRSFTDGTDWNGNLDVNYSGKLNIGPKDPIGLKVGGRYQFRTRAFERRSFYHEVYGDDVPDEVFRVADGEFGSNFRDDLFRSGSDGGLILVESIDEASRNAYDADEAIDAQYVMLDVPLKILGLRAAEMTRLIGGVRREGYRLDLVPYNPVTGTQYTNPLLGSQPVKAKIDEADLLPSLNLLTDLRENLKLRVSYSQTIARAEFREVAPFEYMEFYGGDRVVGYQNLKTSDIVNYDVRSEWYPYPGELVAIGFYAKDFHNPIEVSLIELPDMPYKTYQNAKSAEVKGVELEVRKRLPVLQRYGATMLIFNGSLSRSNVISQNVVTLFNGVQVQNSARSTQRPLQGQSDFLMNVELNYQTWQGLEAALAFHTFSKRLYLLGSAGLPDIYEYPFYSLNATIKRKFNRLTLSAKVKNILDSDIRLGQIEPSSGDLKLTKTYKPGQAVSLGIGYDF